MAPHPWLRSWYFLLSGDERATQSAYHAIQDLGEKTKVELCWPPLSAILSILKEKRKAKLEIRPI